MQKLPLRFVTGVVLLALAIGAELSASANPLDHWTSSQVVVQPNNFGGTYLSGVAYGNGRYVAVGGVVMADGSLVQTSEDGVNWTLRSVNPGGGSGEIYDVAFGNGIFVAVGWFGGIYTSTNGISWGFSGTGGGNLYRVIYGDGQFVAVGDDRDVVGLNVYTSPDGISWKWHQSKPLPMIPWTRSFTDVAYGAGNYVAIDSDGYTYIPTGDSWIRRLTGSPGKDVHSYLNYCNGQFIALDWRGTNVVSTDRTYWSPMVKDTTNAFTRVIYKDGIYVALSGTLIFTSTNGTNWLQRNFPAVESPSLSSVTIGERNGVIVGTTYPGRQGVPVAFVSDPFVAIAVNPGFPPQLSISGWPERYYRIEFRTDPTGAWQPLIGLRLLQSPSLWTDTVPATVTQRYYRAVLLP